jgi:hypothetical protein
MSERTDGVRLAGSVLRRQCHACAFFHNREEEYRLLLPFTREGIGQGDKAFQIVDQRHRQERLERLKKADITYDLQKFSASMVMDIMRTHPMVIIGGLMQENPFFVPPDEFLQELRARSQTAAA